MRYAHTIGNVSAELVGESESESVTSVSLHNECNKQKVSKSTSQQVNVNKQHSTMKDESGKLKVKRFNGRQY